QLRSATRNPGSRLRWRTNPRRVSLRIRGDPEDVPMKRFAVALLALFCACIPTFAGEKELTPAEKGYKALTETAFIPAFWTPKAIPNAWKQWGVSEKPADYDAAVLERYGLHTAPYPNDGLPMGLRKAPRLLDT